MSNDSDFCAAGIETAYRKRDGTTVAVSIAGSRLYDENKNLRGFLLIARDITAQKAASDEITRHREQLADVVEERTAELKQTNIKLKQEMNERERAETQNRTLQEQLHQAQKMEAIGRLAGGIAHDFNNLLFVINGYAAGLRDMFNAAPDVQNDIDQIIEAGTRAVNLTRQLLAFSRKQIIDPVVVDINERLTTSSKMFSRMIGEDIRIHFLPGDGAAPIIMDVTQLDQIIANLLVNARDAMPDGGDITIRTSPLTINSQNNHVHPNLMPGDFVMLEIEDTGCGIPPDSIELIFEPFFTSKDRGKGTGLGLATVYGIVKQNHGCIHVNSTVNQGTVFTILLPQSKIRDTSATGTASVAPTQNCTERILLVEDDTPVRRLAKRQLESAGYRVMEATDAKTAIEIYARHHSDIDLLLTDVVMPGLSGVQMVAEISRRFDPPRVLYMSGHNEEMIDAHGIQKNHLPFLAKPFTAEQLCTRVRDAIDERESQLPEPPMAL